MKLYFYFFFAWILVWTSYSQQPVSAELPQASADCGQIVVKAEARTNYVTTPGYPKPFPGDAKCVWAIYSEPGKRIRLEFQKFFLLQPIAGKCEYHYVIVKTPFNLYSMGPYCGETGLPTIVSTGNLIYVELHTVVPVNTDNYEGFKLAFKETLESSSYELRSDNTAEDEIVTVDPDTMNMLSPTAPMTTTPKPKKSTTKPWRFVPSRRPLQNRPTTRRPTVARRPRPSYPRQERPPSFSNNNIRPSNIRPPSTRSRIITPPKKKPVKIEIIVAIAVGGLVAVTIIIMIALKMTRKKRNETRQKDGNTSPVTAVPDKETNEKQIPLPVMYPDASQGYFYDESGMAYAMQPMAPSYGPEIATKTYPTDRNPNRRRERRRGRRSRREPK